MFFKYPSLVNHYAIGRENRIVQRLDELWTATEKIHGANASYIIDKEGNPQIKEANGPKNGLILEEEAIRIIKSLPTAIPATCDGKPINIMFAIPITFQMQE